MIKTKRASEYVDGGFARRIRMGSHRIYRVSLRDGKVYLRRHADLFYGVLTACITPMKEFVLRPAPTTYEEAVGNHGKVGVASWFQPIDLFVE